jgi:hypothetical protein
MADTTTAPAAAPAPTATTQPAPGASVTPLKPHHSATQPRDDGKRFAGAPVPVEPPKPKAWKLGDVEITDPDELYAVAAERYTDSTTLEQMQRELAEYRKQAERWKDPTKALTPQQKAAIARQQLEEFEQQEREARLPPEQRQFLQQQREFARQKQEFESARLREQQEREAQADIAVRNELVTTVRATLRALGEEEANSVMFREVVAEMRSTAGRNYPPEVLAARVSKRMEVESLRHAARLAKSRPAALAASRELVDALNAIDDPEVLRRFAPLIERGRRMDFARLSAVPGGAAPAAAPPPQGATQQTPLPGNRGPVTNDEWVQWFQQGNRPQAPAEYQAQQRLRALGKL